jgi:hypothetical protein
MSAVQKKVLKKRVAPVADAENSPVPDTTEPTETVSELSFIPSSRVSNYVSGHKLNKDYDALVAKIREQGWESVGMSEEDTALVQKKLADSQESNAVIQSQIDRINAGEDLKTVLSVEDQEKVGRNIKSLEEKNKTAETPVTIDIRECSSKLLSKRLVTGESAAVDQVSKRRAKFSRDSFEVLAAFGDMVVSEITKYTFEHLAETKFSTVEPKYLFDSNASQGPLFAYYSTLPSYKNALNEVETPEREINFKFYVKSIVYEMKKTDDSYSNFKVSERYQRLCSDIVLDILDDATDLAEIILQVMNTKTISAKLFKTCIYTKTHKTPGHAELANVLDSKFP